VSLNPPWHVLFESQQVAQPMHPPPELDVLDASFPPLVLLVLLVEPPPSSPPLVDVVLEYELLVPPDEPDDPVLEPKLLLAPAPPPSFENLPLVGRVSPAAQALATAPPVKAKSKTTDPPERARIRLNSLRSA
jgi:hypothetical protein